MEPGLTSRVSVGSDLQSGLGWNVVVGTILTRADRLQETASLRNVEP